MYFVCFYHGLCLKGKPWSSGYPDSKIISNGPMRSLEKQQEQTCLQWSGTVSWPHGRPLRPFLPVFPPFLPVFARFCPFFTSFCLFLPAYARFCPFLPVFTCFCPFLPIFAHHVDRNFDRNFNLNFVCKT